MLAVVRDPSGTGVESELEGIFEYKLNSSSTWTTVPSTSTAIKSGGKAEAVIPAKFTNALADGTEVDWRVEASNGNPGGRTSTRTGRRTATSTRTRPIRRR
jgi:hypothetical protein